MPTSRSYPLISRFNHRLVKIFIIFTLLFTALFVIIPISSANNPDGDLRIEIVTAYNFIVDSNVESPSTYAPESAYIGAYVCNDGTSDLTDVYAYIGNYIDGINDTPGIYPSRTHSGLVGTFSLTHEGGTMGTADAARYIGDLPAGECVTQYWLVSYPRLDETGSTVTGGIKPDDDLWLEYDIWATANDGITSLLAEETRKATMRNEISAAANKIWPNGDNKVPEEYKAAIAEFLGWDTISPSGNSHAYPGEVITTKGIWYDLGNVGQGFDNDGDLVPDQNAWMQPVGDPGLFLPGCFRLVRTYGIVVVKLKGGGEYLIPFEDQLYFENVPDNTGAVGLVFYEYLAMNGACEAFMTPYQEVASGFDNEKFNGDYGIYMPSLVSLEPPVNINKTVDQTVIGPSLPVDLQYTIDITNTGPVTTGLPLLGLPVVINDSIPIGTSYITGTAVANNILPTDVTTYTVRYSTDNGTTWFTTEPTPADSVTDLQWRLSDGMPPGTTGTVTFGVTVPDGYAGAVVPNTAVISFGDATPFAEDDATTLIRGVNSIGDTVWSDDGAGGGVVGDGTINGSEGGISGVTVTLYYDADGSGTIDSNDLLWATDITDGSGNYDFTNLPDGRFIVTVSPTDPGLPTGYIPSTDTIISVNLDAAGSISSPVDYLDADFGFSPVLALDKTLSSPSPIYEGETIQYTLTITSLLPNGSGPVLDAAYWATDAITGTIFANSPPTDYLGNVIGAPDGNINSSYSGTGSNKWIPNPTLADMVRGTGYSVPQCGNITQVEALYYIDIDGLSGADDDQLRGKIHFGGDDWYEFVVPNADLETIYSSGITELAVDITNTNMGHSGSITDWALWDNVPANEIEIGLAGDLIVNTDNGTLNVDAIGVRFTVDDPACTAVGNGYDPDSSVTPLPLADTYDPTKLQFLSASIAPDSSLPAGTLHWDNLGPLNAGDTKTITVSFLALEPLVNIAETITNTAAITNAYTGSGLPTNDASDDAPVTLMPTGSIGDRVWRDSDGMGDQDIGETGIPNVIVFLTPPAGVDLGNGVGVAMTTTTDADGYYLFDGLKFSGDYTVAVDTASLPVGSGSAVNTYDEDSGIVAPDNSTVVTLDHDATDGSDEHDTADFGYTLPTLIDGTIWHDRNQSATSSPDTGEEWLTGVTVELYDSGGLVAATTSDANGYFEFTGNFTGVYTVTITTGSGDMSTGSWSQSYDTDGTGTGDQASVAVVSGGYGHVDFSYYQTGTLSIGDTVYYDWDGDGVQDANEEGITSITVSLYEDSNADGIIDPDTDALVATTTTSNTGFYSFTGLPAGDYIVDIAESDTDFPLQYLPTEDPDETGSCSVCDGQGVVPLTVVTDTIDFGYQPFGFGSIGDTVWYDVNGDGTQSGLLETGLPDITVELWADMNGDGVYTLIATTTTDADGVYLFDDLPDGAYEVRVDTADSDLPTDPFGNNYVATTETAVSTTITNGNSYLDADFGFTQLGAIGDTVYWDANGDGEQDWNENGVSGVLVTLTNTSTITDTDGTVYVPGTFTLTDTTDADGKYLFTALVPGEYDVSVDTTGPVNGIDQTADPDRDGVTCTDNSYPAMPACDDATGVTVNYGTSFMGADFGYQPKGAFGDFVWFDQDGDGVQDGGEIGIGGLVVSATTPADVIINGVNYPIGTTITTTTDYDGYYSFDGLISNGSDATWTVTVQTPADMSATYDPDGTPDAGTTVVIDVNGDVTAVGGSSCSDCELTVDFGFEMDGPYALTGSVCLEANGSDNGVCGDGTDTAVSGYTVYLYNDDDDYLGATTTDPTGVYTFTNLIDDIYYVSIGSSLPPLDTAVLTTTAADTPADAVTDTGSSVYQTVAVNATTAGSDGGSDANTVENVDFAYVSTIDYDYGDLPAAYSTLLGDAPSGPRHTVPANPTLYLGSLPPDSENDGVNSFLADGDGADEDGVTAVSPTTWTDGVDGGSVSVDVTGTGWLVGWIDFNGDGDFTDADEMIVTRAVTTGNYNITFDIPAGTIGGGSTEFYSRFRLFSERPLIDTLAYMGSAEAGEVEDYLFSTALPGSIGDYVWIDSDGEGDQDEPLAGLSGVRIYIDLNGNGRYDDGEPNDVTDTTGAYDIIGLPAGSYTVTVDADTIPTGYILTTGNDPFIENLTAGEDVNTADFGFMLQTAGVTKAVIDDNLAATVLPDVAVGELITYQLQISPTMGVFPNAVLTDTLDAGLAFVGCSSITASADLSTSIGSFNDACNDSVNPTVTGAGELVVFDFGTITNVNANMLVPERITITYQAVVVNTAANNQGDNRNNTAVFAWDTGSSSGSSADVTITEPFLTLAKTVSPVSTYPGDTITYTLTIAHTGGSDQPAYDLVLTDTVPAGLTYVANSLAHVSGAAAVVDDAVSPDLTVTLGVLPVGQSSTIEFQAVVDSPIATPAVITNTGNLVWSSMPGDVTTTQSSYNPTAVERTGDSSDPGGSANDLVASDDVGLPVESLVDLELTKDVNNSTPNLNDIITYTVSLTNLGPDTATNVVVNDQLPVGLAYDSHTPSQGSYDSGTGDWDVGTVTVNQVVTLTISAQITMTGQITNTAAVTAVDQHDSDSEPANNIPGEDDQDDATVDVPHVADLSIDKTSDNYMPNLGETVVFTLTVHNAGPDLATNVTVSDVLPVELSYVDQSASQGSYNSGTGLWAVGDMAVSQSETLVMTTTVAANGVFTNTAVITLANEVDPDSSNNKDDTTHVPPLRLGNHIWFDANDDGFSNNGEPGVADVVVELLDASGVPVLDPVSGLPLTDTTNVNGFYAFDDLAPGDYRVRIAAANFDTLSDPLFGWRSSTLTYTADDTVDGNDSGINEPYRELNGVQSDVVTLMPETEPTTDAADEDGTMPDDNSNLTVDFGFFELLTLGNRIWFDGNDDGLMNDGPGAGTANVIVNLLDQNGDPILHPSSGLPITATTNTDGYYLFTNLLPGDYIVQIAPENFQTGGALVGFRSSSGSVDPDDDIDSDDNGKDGGDPTVNGILSDPITLNYDTEPDGNSDTDDNDNTNLSVDFGLYLESTAVTLISFTAVSQQAKSVQITWQTATEIDNYGFELWRSDEAVWETAVQIHTEPAVGTGIGTTYHYQDAVPANSTWYYWLVDVDTHDEKTRHGPVSVVVKPVFQLFIPFVIR